MNDRDAILTAVQDHLRIAYPFKDYECEKRQDLTVPASYGELFVAVSPGTYGLGPAEDEASMWDRFVGVRLGLNRRLGFAPDDRQYPKVYAEATAGLEHLAQRICEIMRRDRWQILYNANTFLSEGRFVEPLILSTETAEITETDPEHFNADPTDELPVGALVTVDFDQARYMKSLFEDAPVAEFAAAQTTVPRDTELQFWNHVQGKVLTLAWDFDDLRFSGEWAPKVSWADPGLKTVSLTVTGPGGTDIKTKPGYITVT